VRILSSLAVDDWKRGVAQVILYAYGWQLCGWPMAAWITTLITALTGYPLPVPPLLPWELLAAGTLQLATIGGIQTWRESVEARQHPKE
jgi:hypothetical protein